MSAPKTDVVIIGAGVAGFAAALAARRQGASVEIVSAHAGATSLSGGAWDVCSDLYGSVDEVIRPLRTLAEEIETRAYEDEYHPYARLGEACLRTIEEAHALVLPALAIYRPLDLHSKGVLVGSDLGLLRRTATAQKAVLDLSAAGTFDTTVGANIPTALTTAVVSLVGDRSTDADFLAASWTELMSLTRKSRTFVPVALDFFRRKDDALLHPHEVAAIGDSEDGIASIANALKNALQKGRFSSVLVPPMLGHRRDDVPGLVEDLVGIPVGEWLQPLAGPQGLRLSRRIDEVLASEGCVHTRGAVSELELGTSGIEVRFIDGSTRRPGAVVMATGKHVGGGLAMRDGDLVEPLAGLPIYIDGRLQPLGSSPEGRDPALLFGNDPFSGGPGFRAGVGYDNSMRALGRRGEAASQQLFVAGALLEGFEPSRDGTGLGCCATTGYVAGKNAASFAGRS
ncbi:MAG: FAD-binding protein [Sandaracinaceae bacterium]|jgi:glycerol-3-phosphate dehydrogenase subunit B|nr:FAD-binding protein [Sandaracinaceae bacterium]